MKYDVPATGGGVLARTKLFTRTEKILSVARMYKTHGDKSYKAFPRIEDLKTNEARRAASSNGNIFEPAVRHLNLIGVPTDANLAGVMASLEFNAKELHDFGCFCNQETISGHHAAYFLEGMVGAHQPVEQDINRFARLSNGD